MVAEIIQLNGLDEEDREYNEFLDELRTGNVRATFIIEREDGTVAVGTTGQERKELVYDIYRLQELCRKLVMEN